MIKKYCTRHIFSKSLYFHKFFFLTFILSINNLLVSCAQPINGDATAPVDLSQVQTATDLLNLPIQQLYPKIITDQLVNNATVNLSPILSSAAETESTQENIENQVVSNSEVAIDESYNVSPYLLSSLVKLDIPKELSQDHFKGRLEGSLNRDITGSFNLPAIDLDTFSADLAEPTAESLVDKDITIEVDAPPADIEALRSQNNLFLTVSPDINDNPDYHVDGIEDDTEIQEALTRAWDAGGGMVFLYPGTYHIKKQLGVWDYVTLKGSGRVGERATVLKLIDYSDSLAGHAGIIRMKKDFVHTRQDKRVYHATIEDFIVDGNREHQTHGISDSEKKYGFYGEGDYITIRRITNRNCMGYGFDPHASVDTRPSKYMLIEDSYALNNYKDGFTLDMVQESRFVNNVAEYNARHGFNIITHAREVIVADNIARYNGGAGLKVQNGAHSVTYINNHFYGNKQEGVYLRSSSDNQFVNNIIFNNNKNGIRITGTKHTTFENNIIAFNSMTSSRYPEILIENYSGFYENWTEKSVSLTNDFENNLILVNSAKSVLLETGESNWNTITENTIWTEGEGITLLGLESRNINNLIKPEN